LAQASTPCVNDALDPFQRGVSFAPLPDERSWGSTAGVTVAPDGAIWAYDRCGATSCAGSSLDLTIAFSPDGKVLRHFGGGLLQMPHGLMLAIPNRSPAIRRGMAIIPGVLVVSNE
jgi:hypothetical protein